MADTIVDNSPEMNLDDPKFAEMLAGVAKVEPEPKGGKPKVDLSPEPTQEKVETEPTDDTPESLKAQIKGLKAELTRRAGNADKVEDLEAQLQNLQGQLQAINQRPQTSSDGVAEAIQKLDDKGIITKLTDWQDELAAARIKYDRAEELGDDAKLTAAARRIDHAKKVLSALTEEKEARSERRTKQAQELQSEALTINEELTDMYETVSEAFPDFTNPDTDLWKAGDEEFRNHPALMSRMGPAGEIVAAAMAIVRNPNLVGGKGTAATRREVISKIDRGLNRALSGGAASPTTGRTIDYGAAVSTGDSLAQFNAMVDKIKGG